MNSSFYLFVILFVVCRTRIRVLSFLFKLTVYFKVHSSTYFLKYSLCSCVLIVFKIK